ncbi:MAG TPA: ribosome biogenesis GTP-binding protein YihA/YsxC, partial [Gallionellaceae bacterium]|nr:ribosome biogenesis GTP-binding protein YihA/YsxC [Gallionellaceae bacterium]
MSHYPQASFLTSAHQPTQFVADEGAEVAFAGRSNAGKSSAINAIVNQRNFARTSKSPGRTQLINFFHLREQQRLVDLPGYGYAKVPQSVQKHWRTLMGTYFEKRQSLKGVIV